MNIIMFIKRVTLISAMFSITVVPVTVIFLILNWVFGMRMEGVDACYLFFINFLPNVLSFLFVFLTCLQIPVGFVQSEYDPEYENGDVAANYGVLAFHSVENTYQQHECGVCLENFNDDDSIFRPRCKHLLHKTCAQDCVKHDSSCPTCKRVIPRSLTMLLGV